jgi:hypothetical protein
MAHAAIICRVHKMSVADVGMGKLKLAFMLEGSFRTLF